MWRYNLSRTCYDITLKTFNLPPIGYKQMGPISILGDPWFPICPIWGCIQHFQLLPLVQCFTKEKTRGYLRIVLMNSRPQDQYELVMTTIYYLNKGDLFSE